jgi:hypothetical protein
MASITSSRLEMGSPVPCQVLDDRGLTNTDGELEEFAMDPVDLIPRRREIV